jgi:LysM repeat protein
MTRMTIFRSSRLAIVMVGALAVPTFAFSQDSTVTARTHVVRKGDTLWDIAREYTNDPYRWKEVYQLNTATVRDPHWIYPGERLTLPGAAAADNTAVAAPVTMSHESKAEAVAESKAEPVAEPKAEAVTESKIDSTTESMPQPTVDLAATPMTAPFEAATVFRRAEEHPRPVLTRVMQDSQAQTRAAAPTIRPGEFYAAPWVERDGGPANAGTIVGTGDVPGIPLTEAERPLQSHERIFITVPPGMSSAAGARYVAVRRGPMLDGVGQVMVPTGIVVVERAQRGQAVEARIVARSEPMEIGDQLVTMVTPPVNLPKPAPVGGGGQTRVLWTYSEPVLPSLQSYLVVAAVSGLRVGDQITFYRPRRTSNTGVVLPESEIGVAQIVRVTPQASTALVIDQTYGAIEEGTPARVTAKMP